MMRRESYERGRGRRPVGRWNRPPLRRERPQSLPVSTATALQDLGLILPERPAPVQRGLWQAVEQLPQPVLFLLSFTCFGLLLALLAWRPWR